MLQNYLKISVITDCTRYKRALAEDLQEHHPKVLDHFIEKTKERDYRIWKRDPMAILMNSKKKVEQKIDYIHNNPLAVKWNLVKRPEDYQWSSASFYLEGDKRYSFITDYREYFG